MDRTAFSALAYCSTMDAQRLQGDDDAGRPAAKVDRVERTPPLETPAKERTRRWIIFTFWVVVACLGLPHWLWTTSIHRSELPLETMNSWSEGRVSKTPHDKIKQG